MKTIINNTIYQGGKRITEQTVTYTKADDIQTLGRLHMTLATTLAQIDNAKGTEPHYQRLVDSIKGYEAAIATQQAIVDGYPETEE